MCTELFSIANDLGLWLVEDGSVFLNELYLLDAGLYLHQ
jgi:hypothetical protein